MKALSQKECRSCGSLDMEIILDLGSQPLANSLVSDAIDSTREPMFPLVLSVCTSCWLLQLRDLLPPIDLFSDYLYFSSFSETMLEHSRVASERYMEEYHLGAHSFVVEVASNDGYLLKNFIARGIPCLGVEPAENIARLAIENGIPTEVRFFGGDVAIELKENYQAADLILGNNVFAHVPEPYDFARGVKEWLSPEGVLILEFPYAVDLLANLEFDTIYHEHVFYYALTPLIPLFERVDLQVVSVERIPIHGGSLRVFIRHKGDVAVENSVGELLQMEKSFGINSINLYHRFAVNVMERKSKIRELLLKLVHEGSVLAAYGASAKGSTLLNSLDLPDGTITFMVDRSPHKQGLRSPGLNILICDPEKLTTEAVDYALLLTWNFRDEILRQQQLFRDAGGRFIIPLPTLEIV